MSRTRIRRDPLDKVYADLRVLERKLQTHRVAMLGAVAAAIAATADESVARDWLLEYLRQVLEETMRPSERIEILNDRKRLIDQHARSIGWTEHQRLTAAHVALIETLAGRDTVRPMGAR